MKFDNYDIYNDLKLLPLDLDGWDGNHYIFKDLISKLNPTKIIEVGTWKGQSAICMANFAKSLNLNCKIYCIDTWLGSLEHWLENSFNSRLKNKNGYPQIYQIFLSNVIQTKNQNIICPIQTTSNIAAQLLKFHGISAQLIYIDGSHILEDIESDLKNYWELLDDDGIIFGHDFSEQWPYVKSAVIQFCNAKNLKYEVLDTFWIIRKARFN